MQITIQVLNPDCLEKSFVFLFLDGNMRRGRSGDREEGKHWSLEHRLRHASPAEVRSIWGPSDKLG